MSEEPVEIKEEEIVPQAATIVLDTGNTTLLGEAAPEQTPQDYKKRTTPDGIDVRKATLSNGYELRYVMAAFIGNGIPRGSQAFIAGVHPGLTHDGGIYDLVTGNLHPIDLRVYHKAVGSQQFAHPQHQELIKKLYDQGKTGSEIWSEVSKLDGLIKPLNELNEAVGIPEPAQKPDG